MNKDFWIEQLKKREVFERAYVYAIYYQIKEDAYCNFIEITYYRQNKEKLFKEIELSLENPSLYEPETAFSFYLPKSDMFFRRMIYTPFKDLVIKFILVSVLVNYWILRLSTIAFHIVLIETLTKIRNPRDIYISLTIKDLKNL